MKAVLMPAWDTHAWTPPRAAESPAQPCSCQAWHMGRACVVGPGVPGFRCSSWFVQELPTPLTIILVYFFLHFWSYPDVNMRWRIWWQRLPEGLWCFHCCVSNQPWPRIYWFSWALFQPASPHTHTLQEPSCSCVKSSWWWQWLFSFSIFLHAVAQVPLPDLTSLSPCLLQTRSPCWDLCVKPSRASANRQPNSYLMGLVKLIDL